MGITVESSTPPRPVLESRLRNCGVSTLYEGQNYVNACWNNVFWVINPLFLSPLGYRRIVNPSTTCSWTVLDLSWEVWTSYLENCANASRSRQTDRLDPLFLTAQTDSTDRHLQTPQTDLSDRESLTVPVKFQTDCILKDCADMTWQTFTVFLSD